MVTPDEVRRIALSMPEAVETGHWGKPSFRVQDKIFAVLQEDGVSLLVKTTKDDRLAYTTMEPEIYSVPANYSTLNYMIVRMDRIALAELHVLIVQAWKSVAPKRLVAGYDAAAMK